MPVALAFGTLAACGTISLQPAKSGPVAAVFPPWWNGTQALLAAAPAGAIVRYGAWPNIIIIAPAGADAAAQLRRAGAWAILDPRALGACGNAKQKAPEE